MTGISRIGRTSLLVPLVAALLILGACGSDAEEAPGAESSAEATATTPEVDESTDADAPTADVPTGEPRGTVEIDGVVHELIHKKDVPGSSCQITADAHSSVIGMASESGGISVTYGGGELNWRASVTDYDQGGDKWEVAKKSVDGQDVTREVSEGRAVIEGTWGVFRQPGPTQTIRLELLCPPQ